MNGLNPSIKSRDGQVAFYKTRPDELLTTSAHFKQKDEHRSKVKSCRQTCRGSPVGRKLGGSAYQTPFSGGSDDEESAGKAGGPGLLPGSGRVPGEGHGSPLQHPCLEDPMDRGACWTAVHAVAKSRPRLERFSMQCEEMRVEGTSG